MFDSLSKRLSETFRSLRGKGRLSAADIDETLRDIRKSLLEADVALDVVKTFIGNIRERALGDEVSKALNPAQQVVQIVNSELIKILGGETRRLQFSKTPPTIIMLAGLQGSGKTTFAAKLANLLKSESQTPLLVACDLQRPNAVDQLKVLGEKIAVPVFAPEPGNGVGNPLTVARQAIEKAKKDQHSVVIIDTAGRLGVDQEMMQQAIDIRNAVEPDELIFVIDSMLGQDAVNVAKAFQDGVGISAVALTKLDGDARGGAALSVATITGKPILYSSTGESIEALEIFHPERMASRILDLGDGLKGIMGMLPGMGKLKNDLEQFDDKIVDRTQAIIQSMTPLERNQPRVLNGSRRIRIAKGSGTSVTEVNQLMQRFEQAAKAMKTMAKGGPMPGAPFPVANKKAAKPAKKSGSKSGNPAKRAAENQGISYQPKQSGSSFGLGN